MNATWNWFLAEAGRGAAFLFQWSWQALVLLACVWLGLKAFRVQSPAIRCQVWLFGLMAVAAMPLWASVADFFPLPQPRIETLRYAVEMPAMVIAANPEPATVAATPAYAESILKWLKENSDSRDIKAWDVSALQDQLDKLPLMPPPPPPPPPAEEQMTVKSGKELKTLRWHKDDDSVFALLRQAADASIRRDTSFFERVFDEDYIETGPNGETYNKAQAIAKVKMNSGK